MKKWINGEIVEMTEEEIQALDTEIPPIQQIELLKEELSTYDYIGVKIAMGVGTKEEYAEQITYTEKLRQQIRDLENQIEFEEIPTESEGE